MLGLFVTLGIAILTLLVILLWFVPHLLQQQEQKSASEAAHLREMLLDVLHEQEDVTLRQGQLGTSLSYLQEQLEHIGTGPMLNPQGSEPIDFSGLQALENHVRALQSQIETQMNLSRTQVEQSNESWFHLLSLLAAILERIRELSTTHAQSIVSVQGCKPHEHRCH